MNTEGKAQARISLHLMPPTVFCPEIREEIWLKLAHHAPISALRANQMCRIKEKHEIASVMKESLAWGVWT